MEGKEDTLFELQKVKYIKQNLTHKRVNWRDLANEWPEHPERKNDI